MDNFFNRLNKPKNFLLAANIALILSFILLFNAGILPFKNLSDFLFFAFIGFAFALYRPGWSFLFFVGSIALENVNLAPDAIGISLRPYQLFGALTVLAVLVRIATNRLNFKLTKMSKTDWLLIIILIAGFASALGAQDKGLAFRLSAIYGSFLVLYFLTRNYLQTPDDVKKIVPFFLTSSILTILYGVWQSILFINGKNSFEVMPGRPNSTFTEPDWYGAYLVFFIALIYSLLFFQSLSKKSKDKIFNFKIISYVLLITSYVSLILTVSRSAWLGAFFVTFVFLFVILTELKFNFIAWKWKDFLKNLTLIAFLGGLSLFAVYFLNLTNFQLFNRFQSTGTGLQKITVSCQKKTDLPAKVSDNQELEDFYCRHINIEEINSEISSGKYVTEIYREDPNVNIRKKIYETSLQEIRKHPIFGIGWGNISSALGKDERGAGLNSSNIFLETWLGAGMAGLAAFIVVWLIVLKNGIKFLMREDLESKSLGIFVLLGTFAILIPNMFNAGIFLGFLYLFLGIAQVKNKF